MARRTLLAIVLCAALGAVPALAKTGDMFDDNAISVQNRPEVPSDQYYGWRNHPDMLPNQQSYVRTDKDMFDSVPVPGNTGIEQEFSAHGNPRPPLTPLFHNPNEQQP